MSDFLRDFVVIAHKGNGVAESRRVLDPLTAFNIARSQTRRSDVVYVFVQSLDDVTRRWRFTHHDQSLDEAAALAERPA